MKARALLATLVWSAGLLVWTGTTFIIKEGGVEVGRYSEEDGRDEEVVVEDDSASASVPPPAAEQETSETQTPQAAAEGETWNVSGRVIDVVHLTEVHEGKLVFSGEGNDVEAALLWNGGFSAKLPRNNGGYRVAYVLPSGDRGMAFLGSSGAFKSLPYEERLKLKNARQVQDPIAKPTISLEIGVYPRLTAEEERQLRAVTSGSAKGN